MSITCPLKNILWLYHYAWHRTFNPLVMISFLIRMPSHVTISISTSFLTECVIKSKWPYEGIHSSEKQEVVTLADKTSRSPLLRRAFNNTVRVTRCRVNFKLSRREQIWQFGFFSFVNTVVEVEDPLHRHTQTHTQSHFTGIGAQAEKQQCPL